MLQSISISNFYSIGKEQTASFRTGKKDGELPSVAATESGNLNLVSCIVGHNASGKTSILKAISFVFWLIKNSYTSVNADDDLPVESHKLHPRKATEISIEFSNFKTRFRYAVKIKNNKIIYEYLGKHIERGYARMFEYSRTKSDWKFQSNFEINNNDLARFKLRENVAVISSLIETGYLQELMFVKNFESNVTNLGILAQHPVISFFKTSKKLHDDKSLLESSQAFLKDIDVGISGFEFGNALLRGISNEKAEKVEVQKVLECIHESSKGKFKLPLIEESNGTRHSLLILTDILPVLKSGGLVVVDEIESGLHPYVAKKIVSLFENRKTNPFNAQIIFSTHQHLLMNDRAKSQIFICEKDGENFETEVYRLDEVEGVRNDENFFQKYLAGSYGGVPMINWSN